jgi:anti-sigma B factor antagonist
MSIHPAGVSASRLKLEVSDHDGGTTVRLSGRLTLADTAAFKDEVKHRLPQTKRIVLDLTDLTFMDSSGLGAIVSLYVSAKAAGCALGLINLSKQLRELLRFTRVLSLFEACGQYPARMP